MNQTILLVEDTIELAQAISRELRDAGFQVVHAADGVAALEAFAREQPDLVVLDWMLPRLDGLEVLKRLRQTSTTPVLMLTARSEEADLVIGLELGADDYLAKPFGNRELVARIRAMLRRNAHLQHTIQTDQTPSATLLVRSGLQLDPAAYSALLDGQPLDLTPIEWRLLDIVLRNPGRAFSRAYLLDAVWGHDYVGGDRSVDNTILRLRKKLGSIGDEIETVWGIGYRLRPEPA